MAMSNKSKGMTCPPTNKKSIKGKPKGMGGKGRKSDGTPTRTK